MLEIKGLEVKLQEEDKQILKGVNLSIGAGEVHAIMGPNGSGSRRHLMFCRAKMATKSRLDQSRLMVLTC